MRLQNNEFAFSSQFQVKFTVHSFPISDLLDFLQTDLVRKVTNELKRIQNNPVKQRKSGLARLAGFLNFVEHVGEDGNLSEHIRRKMIYKLKSFHH